MFFILLSIVFGQAYSQQNPNMQSIYTNQTYTRFNWYNEIDYDYQYKFTREEIVLSEGNISESFIEFNNLVPNTDYNFYLKIISNNTVYDNYNIQTLDYLELLPPEVSYLENKEINVNLTPYFYDYPMYEFINTSLLAKSLNTSIMFYIYNDIFKENINISDYRFENDNIYQIKRLIVNNLNQVLIESNYSNSFSIVIPTTSTNTQTSTLTSSTQTSTLTSTTQSDIIINNTTNNDNNDNDFEFTWVIILIIVLSGIIAISLITFLIYTIYNNHKIKHQRLNRINQNTFTNTYNPEFNPNVDTTSIYTTNHPNMVPRNMMFE